MSEYKWREDADVHRLETTKGRATVREGAFGWMYRVEARTPAGFRAINPTLTDCGGWYGAGSFERAKAKCEEWLDTGA